MSLSDESDRQTGEGGGERLIFDGSSFSVSFAIPFARG